MAKISNEEKMDMMNRMMGNQTEDTPKEDVKEEASTEEKVEEQEDVQTEEKVEHQTEEVQELDLALLNKTFGKEYENLDAYKTLFEKADSYDKTKSEYDGTLKKLDEYKNLAEGIDPMSYFASEDEYIRQQFLRNSDGKFSEDAIKALSVLSPSSIQDMNGVEALKVDLMVNDGMTSEEASAYLLKKYDIDDFDSEDLELGTKATIKKDVNDARKSLSKLYDGITVPERKDYEALRSELKQSWEKPLKDLVDGVSKVEVIEGFDFVVTDEMKSGLYDKAIDALVGRQVGVSEEAIAELENGLRNEIISNNFEKVLKSYAADLEESFKAKTRSDYHNDKPDRDDAKVTTGSNNNESKMRKLLG